MLSALATRSCVPMFTRTCAVCAMPTPSRGLCSAMPSSSPAGTASSPSLKMDEAVILGTYARTPLHIVRGDGAFMIDNHGQRYLDFAAGIAVNVLGTGNPVWLDALTQQARKLVHCSNLYVTDEAIRLGELLLQHSGFHRIFFCNSGTEANEAALKFARKYVRHKHGPTSAKSKNRIVAFNNGFHGRTMGALSVTGKASIREHFQPLIPNVTFLDFNDVQAVHENIADDVESVIVEPIQGEGGINVGTKEFMQAIRARCDAVDAVLIADEVQCGLGRTGRLWAHSATDVVPDIMSLAKPLAGGLPIGATLVNERVASAIASGDHGSTFAGNPLACAVARAVVQEIVKPSMLESVAARGRQLVELIEAARSDNKTIGQRITEVRTAGGLLIGLQLHESVDVDRVLAQCRAGGLLVPSCGTNTVRMCPPFVVEEQHIDMAVDIFLEAVVKDDVLVQT